MSTDLAQPIAEYRERRFGWRRTLQLFEDRVRISLSAWFVGSGVDEVMLCDLLPEPTRGSFTDRYTRSILLGVAVAICVIGVFLIPAVEGRRLGLGYHIPVFASILVFGIGAFVIPKQIEHVSFRGTDFLTVQKSGDSPEEFVTFVSQISRQIRDCNGSQGSKSAGS